MSQEMGFFLPKQQCPIMLADHLEGGLYCVGDAEILFDPSVAVLGSIKATPYGLAVSTIVGEAAAEEGMIIVCPAERGCSHAAASAAIDCGGKAVLVACTGPDIAYPPAAAQIFERVVRSGGLIISREPLGSGASAESIARRDEILPYLSDTLIVTEASMPSRELEAARTALSSGIRVHSVPGSIFASNSDGANMLIASGAHPLVSKAAIQDAIAAAAMLYQIDQPADKHIKP